MSRATKENPRLYEAVLADPDNDAPRLAYADWFETNGQAQRARFIRLQCEVARLPVGDLEAPRLSSESMELSVNRDQWLGDRPRGKDIDWVFSRGFPEHVYFSSFTSLQKYETEVLRYPIRGLGFRRLRSFRRLAGWPGLAQVRELYFNYCQVLLDGLEALIHSPYVGRLTLFSLGVAEIGPDGARLLAAWPQLAELRKLKLARARIGDEGLEALAGSRYLTNLTTLTLASNDIGPAGLRSVADCGCWPGLVELSLMSNRIGNEGVAELARASQWRNLTLLDLGRNRISDEGIAALVKASWLDRLIVLYLGDNLITDAGSITLADAASLSGLRKLELRRNLIGTEGAKRLGRSPHLTALRRLNLDENAIRPNVGRAVMARFRDEDTTGLDQLGKPSGPIAVIEMPAPPLLNGRGSADEKALLQAILDDPDDDVSRLVYADWLEENGQPERAEIIRLQCDPSTDRFSPREKELTEKIIAGYPPAMKKYIQACWFNQGLLEVWVLLRTFLGRGFQEQAPGWMREAGVHSMLLRGKTKLWQKVAASPVLECIQELALWDNNLDSAGLAALAGSTYLTGLHTLYFSHNRLRQGLGALLRSASLPRLRRLRLQEAGIGQDELHALTDWPQLGRLTTLGLSINDLGAAGLAVLCNGPNLTGLVQLELTRTKIGDEGCWVLARSPLCAGLRRLTLGYNDIGKEGVHNLVDSPYLHKLQVLELGGNSIADEGIHALLDWPRLDQLRLLTLTEHRISAESAEQLTERLGDRLRLTGW